MEGGKHGGIGNRNGLRQADAQHRALTGHHQCQPLQHDFQFRVQQVVEGDTARGQPGFLGAMIGLDEPLIHDLFQPAHMVGSGLVAQVQFV